MTTLHFSSLHPRVSVVMVCERADLTRTNLELLLASRYVANLNLLCLPLQEYEIRDYATSRLAEASIDYQFESIANADQWYKTAHCFLCRLKNRVEERHLLFFLGASIELTEGCLDRLVRTFLANPGLAGINPLFLRKESDGRETVAYQGISVDSQKHLHFLYEGVERTDRLVKPRSFQLAHCGALLLSYADFKRSGGLFSHLEGSLCGLDFCQRLKPQPEARFLVETSACVVQHDAFDAWHICGLWNSLMENGRLKTEVASDYAGFVHEDGYHYGVNAWLQEVAVEYWEDLRKQYLEGERSAFPCEHDPLLLGHWLVSLAGNPLLWEMAVTLSGNLPCLFPHSYPHYEALAERLLAYAREEKEETLHAGVLAWKKSRRRFHYGMLHKTMEVYEESQLFANGLDLVPSSYDAWVELIEPELAKEHVYRELETGQSWPCLALAMPVYKARPDYLQAAVASVREQSYPHWQLCMVDDASDDTGLWDSLKALAASDNRIRVELREKNGGISRATNTAIALSDAPYIGFLDQDDLLAPWALFEVAKRLGQKDALRFLFSDEDVITEDGLRRSPTLRRPFFAADFIPGHLMVYETELVRQLHGFRPAMDGAQDYDLALRAGEVLAPTEIAHIPRILYHWRLHPDSTNMQLLTKPYVPEATRRVLEASFQRRGLVARACKTERPNLFLMRRMGEIPSYSVLVSFGQSMALNEHLAELLVALSEQDGCEIIFLIPEAGQDRARELAQGLALAVSLRTLAHPGQELDVAKAAQGEVLFWLSSDLEPMADCRPQQLVLLAADEGLGLVGGTIFKNGLIWNVGFYPDGRGSAFPLFQGLPQCSLGSVESGLLLATHRVLAPSRLCCAVRRECFVELGGFDQALGLFSEVDLGLRLEASGLTSLVSAWGQWALGPRAQTPTGSDASLRLFKERWGDYLENHPLRHPCLCRSSLGSSWQLQFAGRGSPQS
ncbi:MAG: glycosyltransferase [Desulfovibrio sp.]|nr:glycosyltransferase [Desulfovibrio sp.]